MQVLYHSYKLHNLHIRVDQQSKCQRDELNLENQHDPSYCYCRRSYVHHGLLSEFYRLPPQTHLSNLVNTLK